jgi:hypothetical protein
MQPLPQNLSKYVLVFGNCLLIASKKDFTQNFLFCFESVLYTRLETWGSNEYIRNFEDFIKRENLETRYDKDFLQGLYLFNFWEVTNIWDRIISRRSSKCSVRKACHSLWCSVCAFTLGIKLLAGTGVFFLKLFREIVSTN